MPASYEFRDMYDGIRKYNEDCDHTVVGIENPSTVNARDVGEILQ
jgi:hypothetical protein